MLRQHKTGRVSDKFFEETRGSVKLTLTGLCQDDLDNAMKDVLLGYEEQIVEYPIEAPRLDFWDFTFVSLFSIFFF